MAAEAILGAKALADGPMMMVAEDMAEYLNRVPGSFFVLGAMPDGVSRAEPHHQPAFRHRRARAAPGVAILAEVAAGYLGLGTGRQGNK